MPWQNEADGLGTGFAPRRWLLPKGLGELKPRPAAPSHNPKTGHLDLLPEAGQSGLARSTPAGYNAGHVVSGTATGYRKEVDCEDRRARLPPPDHI